MIVTLAVAAGSPASAAFWNVYFNATTKQSVQRFGVVGNIGGGSAAATIGETGNSYIRTYNVFGTKVHEALGVHSTTVTMTHTIRFDGKSACIWRAKYPASSTTALPMICRDYRH